MTAHLTRHTLKREAKVSLTEGEYEWFSRLANSERRPLANWLLVAAHERAQAQEAQDPSRRALLLEGTIGCEEGIAV